MFYNQTQYAINLKETDAIVYEDVFGERIRITADIIGEEAFAYWKNWMDESLHEEALETHLYYDHTISMEDPSLIGVSLPDHETLMIEAEERQNREKLKQQVATAFFTCLTDIQQARMWLYAVEGYNTCQIAEMEKVSQKNVYISIMKARKNILKFLEKGGYKTAVFAAYSEGAIKNPS